MSDIPDGFPEHGRTADELLEHVKRAHADDIDWRSGRAFSLVYNPDDEEHEHLLEQVATTYLHDNALNPFKYPSVLQMELELIAMGAALMGTHPRNGAVTSGGTESIFLAVQSARDHARATRGIAEPQLLTATTAHPAFAKAAKYLDIEQIKVPVGPDGRADVAAMADAMTDRTGLVVGSAPCYPYGVIDPIADLAAAAAERGSLFHTDACLGGWMLPWWERLGQPVPPWDFRVPGVTSISADLHKYGYAFKGASLVLHRHREVLERQYFWYEEWPGGLYASGTSAGTRSAAPIAGAWAAVTHLGADGYLRMARKVLDATTRFRDGVNAIEGLRVTHDPDMSLFEFGSDTLDINGVGDEMDERGWNLDRQQGGLHLMVSPYHVHVVDDFLADLAASVEARRTGTDTTGTYGGGGIV